jgi:hypothetical protein
LKEYSPRQGRWSRKLENWFKKEKNGKKKRYDDNKFSKTYCCKFAKYYEGIGTLIASRKNHFLELEKKMTVSSENGSYLANN